MSAQPGLLAFADPLGPRGRRRVALATVVALVALVGLLAVAAARLSEKGQFAAKLWRPVVSEEGIRFLAVGLSNTLAAAVVAMVLATIVGLLLALGRLSANGLLHRLATLWIEFFRGIPLLLLILFLYFGLPRYGIDPGRFWFLVAALVLYNSAVIAEIVRAGVNSLDRGQTEAALAVGLRRSQALRSVVLPQALRRMIPSLVSQLVVLLKDTSLGFTIGFEELLRRGQLAGDAEKNPLQFYVAVMVVYLVVNLTLSYLARRLERRQQRVPRAAGPPVVVVPDGATLV